MWRTSATNYLINRHRAAKEKVERNFVIKTGNPFKPVIVNTSARITHARVFTKNSERQKNALTPYERGEMLPPSKEATQIARIKSAALKLLRDTRKQQEQEQQQQQQQQQQTQQLSMERRHALDYTAMVEYMGAQEHFFTILTSATINLNGLHNLLKSKLLNESV